MYYFAQCLPSSYLHLKRIQRITYDVYSKRVPVISDVGKSSLVSLYFEDVTVSDVKSATVTVDSDATPLVRRVTVVLLRGFACATITRPIAFLIVAVSTS